MSSATTDFARFFEAVWETPPFDWQTTLAEQVLRDGRWPSLIDLPTGAGKTSVLDIAVFAMAHRPDVMHRRIAFVVDRRTIVDQTTERAQLLADRLQQALDGDQSDPVAGVAQRLAALGGSGCPLDVGRLRGGAPQSGANEWLRWPDQPAVIVSTVDQFGSRLLFRGYGVNRRMRPVHAGLSGADTLVLLDEVHLSTALVDTMYALEAASTAAACPRPNQFVQMSATPGTDAGTRFPQDPALVLNDPGLRARVQATKLCRLAPPIGKPRQSAEEAWAAETPSLIKQLGLSHGVVGIVVNRVATAVAINATLAAQGHETVLVTGRMRAAERLAADRKAAEWTRPSRPPASDVRFVVATQCIEVGADYSFDALITEICPLASLRQRLGRLDRRGELAAAGTPATALIVSTASQRSPDPVYGQALEATLTALRDAFGSDPFDGGPLSRDLTELGDGLDVARTSAAVLMPGHLDLLAATNPEPVSSPNIDAFLHGFREPNADVSVVWRFDVPAPNADGPRSAADAAAVKIIVDALPPFTSEKIDVPIAAVKRWLASRDPLPVADIDQVGEGFEATGTERLGWRINEFGDAEAVRPQELNPGDVLIVPSSYGGLRDGAWAPDCQVPVSDVADSAARDAGWVVFRPADDDTAWRAPVFDDEAAVSARDELLDHVRTLFARPVRRSDIVTYADRWAVIRPERPTLDGRDVTNSFIGQQVTLPAHLEGVASEAAGMARRCGLPPQICDDFALAGRLHDLGKADERFQLSLVGDEIMLAMQHQLLAKSGLSGKHRRTGDPSLDYPTGTRHEFLSVALALSNEAVLAPAHDPDLVLHLVATHHGHARPWPVVVPDPAPREVIAPYDGVELAAHSELPASFGADHCERFYRLVERYGAHGLAWLETIFRLADHRRSERESTLEGNLS